MRIGIYYTHMVQKAVYAAFSITTTVLD